MHIILADDHILVRDALRQMIERQISDAVVHAVGSLDEALQTASTMDMTPDLVILDFRMPGMDGLAGVERARAALPDARIVLMSGLASREDVDQAIRKGADGFLPKTLPAQALSGALSLVLAGEPFLPAHGYHEVEAGDPTLPAGITASLTRREKEVLHCLMKGQSNKEIARDLDLQEVTIKLHVRSLCRKLDAKNRTQAVLNAMAAGVA